MRPRLRDGADDGMTLIEVMVAISIGSILMAVTIGGFGNWSEARAHTGATERIVAAMRLAHERAVTEGVQQCVDFNTAANTYTVYRYACSDPGREVVNGPIKVSDGGVEIAAPSFISPAGVPSTGATFRPTGSAWAGSVQVIRPNRPSKVYKVNVEGFTGRVSES